MLEFLECIFADIKVQLTIEGDVETAVVFNPYSDNDIVVQCIEHEGLGVEYTVNFETQQCLFNDKEAVIDHIDKYIAGELFVIKFYKGGKCQFTKNILLADIRQLTAEFLSKFFECELECLIDTDFQIRGWTGNYDMNGHIEKNEEEVCLKIISLSRNDIKSDGMRLKKIIEFEKSVLSPIRFRVNYVIVPVYIVFSVLLLIAFGILMEIDDVKYLPYGLILLGGFVLLTVALLASVPFVRKKEIMQELQFYDFDDSKVQIQDVYCYSTEEDTVTFDKYGMSLNGKLYWYNHLRVYVDAGLYMHRIVVSVLFFMDENSYCRIPLDSTSIRILRQFDVLTLNPDALEKITSDPYKAFETIYKNGRL